MNVVFLISDTFRRDHLGFYGNGRIHTPNLDRLASRSTVFENHYAAGFPTMPTRADFATGKWTLTYMGWQPLLEGERVLAQCLRDAEYNTTAVVDTPFYLRHDMNYDRGFGTFFDIPGQTYGEAGDVRSRWREETDRFAPQTALTAARWLERHHREKFFLYVDMWDPHEPWDPPDWYVRMYAPDYDGKPCIYPPYTRWQDRPGMTEADVHLARCCYAGEVTMVDRWMGHLLDMMECMGLMENTAIVFTTDHGFNLGEHGGLFGKLIRARKSDGSTGPEWWLRSPLYEDIVHIPMAIYVPGRAPRRTKALTSAVDIMPTILDLAGVQPPADRHGRSLVPVLQGDDNAGRDFVVSSSPLCNAGDMTRIVDDWARKLANAPVTTITTPRWSFLYSVAGEPAELYDLQADPGQQMNLINTNRPVALELNAKYLNFLKTCGASERLVIPRSTL